MQDIKLEGSQFSKRHYAVRIELTDAFFENTLREKDKVATKQQERTLTYKKGILTIDGKDIDFNDKPNQKELLDILTKDFKKKWHYDEIEEIWDKQSEFPKNYWRKFYTAGDGINNNIGKETTHYDFIGKNTKQIWVNSKYLANN